MQQYITLHQYKVLRVLSHRPQWSVTEIAQTLSISKAAATKCVKRLEQHGVVSKIYNTNDRRSICVSLTQAGHHALHFLSNQHYIQELLPSRSCDDDGATA